MSIKNIVAIGNSVVDLIYPQSPDSVGFLSSLPSLLGTDVVPTAPRSGDQMFLPTETLRNAADKFLSARLKSAFNGGNNNNNALEIILGKYDIAAGGSLANTIASIAHSRIYNGHFRAPLASVKYLSVLDENVAGEEFVKSMPNGVAIGPRHGQCLEVHVIPFENDRIMVTAPSISKATEHYNLSPHVKDEINIDTDMVMIEGFLAFGEHFNDISKETLDGIDRVNTQRAANGRAPIHLVVTASSQPISNLAHYREFIQCAVQTTDVTIHANTGEFRRILDNDEKWRENYNSQHNYPFEGLDGDTLEKAKKNANGYRAAKTAANIDTIENVASTLARQTPHNLRFVVTDGGNDAYVVTNETYLVHTPAPLDKSLIVNKVGAGDAFMAGFWVAQLQGLDDAKSMEAAGLFAQAAIKQDGARLPEDTSFSYGSHHYGGPIALLAESGLIIPPAQQQPAPQPKAM